MLRKVLFALGLSDWCKGEGVHRNVNAGCTRPLMAPIHYNLIEGEDFEVVEA